jgi:hypothetical protein
MKQNVHGLKAFFLMKSKVDAFGDIVFWFLGCWQ